MVEHDAKVKLATAARNGFTVSFIAVTSNRRASGESRDRQDSYSAWWRLRGSGRLDRAAPMP